MLSFFTCLLGFFSCSSSDGEPEVSSPVVSVAPTQITATYEGSVTTLSVSPIRSGLPSAMKTGLLVKY